MLDRGLLKLRQDVINYLQSLNNGFFFATAKVSDNVSILQPHIVGVMTGKMIAIKLKKNQSKLTTSEQKFADLIINNGGHFWVIRKFEDLMEIANHHGWN